MNLYPSFTPLRGLLAYRYSKLRACALNDVFKTLLTGAKSTLDVFPGPLQRFFPLLKRICTTDIRVAEITGTYERETDFDNQFRPLKKHSRERWINTYILHERNEWSPILVHKVDGKYFVEEGHYRVSIARFLGMEFIGAKVWEYETAHKPKETRKPATCCTEKHSAKVFVSR